MTNRQLHCRHGAALAGRAGVLLALLLSFACSKPQPTPGETHAADAFGTTSDMTARIGELIEKSNASTEAKEFKTPSDTTLPARRAKLLPVVASGTPVPFPRLDVPAPIGKKIGSFTTLPDEIIAANDGAVIAIAKKGVTRFQDDVSTDFGKGLAMHAQFNADGTRLLFQQQDAVILFDYPALVQPVTVDAPASASGRAFWLDDDHLMFARETILTMDASEELRISNAVSLYDLKAKEFKAPGWKVRKYAALGTLPAQHIVWGHLTAAYMISPMPAPILKLDNGEVSAILTKEPGVADIQPTATTSGNLFWIRTHNRDGSTGRAMMGRAEANSTATQITGAPTYLLSASPNGEWISYVIRQDTAEFELWECSAADITAHAADFAKFGQASAGTNAGAKAVAQDIEKVFATTATGRAIKKGKFGPELASAPTTDEIKAVGDALRKSLREHFHFNVRSGYDGAVDLDTLFNAVGDYWTETPAMVIGTAALYADSLPTGGTWTLGETARGLSDDVRNEFWKSNGLSYVAALPFGVARERIAGRLSAESAARALYEQPIRPVYLTENLSEDAIRRILDLEFNRATQRKDTTIGQLLDQLRDAPAPNATYAIYALRAAEDKNYEPLKMIAAYRLVESQPASSDGWRELADTLSGAYLKDESFRCYSQGLALDPGNLSLRMDYSDSLLAFGRYDDARAQLKLLRELDKMKSYADSIATKVKLADELEKKR